MLIKLLFHVDVNLEAILEVIFYTWKDDMGRNVRKRTLFWYAPNEDSNRPAHSRSPIRVFVVRMKELWTLGYPKYAHWRFWPDCVNVQAYLNLRWAHVLEGTFSDVAAHMCTCVYSLSENITTSGVKKTCLLSEARVSCPGPLFLLALVTRYTKPGQNVRYHFALTTQRSPGNVLCTVVADDVSFFLFFVFLFFEQIRFGIPCESSSLSTCNVKPYQWRCIMYQT